MPKSEAEAEADDNSDSSILYLNRALDEDASIIANFQSIYHYIISEVA